MSEGLPSYVTRELHEGEKLFSHIPSPDVTARRRIVFTSFRLLVVVAIIAVAAFGGAKNFYVVAAGIYLGIGLFIWTLRLCRTSYAITSGRVVRFVGGKKIEDVTLAESAKPVLLNFAAHDFFIARWIARFISLGPVVEVRRLKPEPWSVKAFFINRDLSRMRIGYPGQSLPAAKIFDDVTVAWEAAQNKPEAT